MTLEDRIKELKCLVDDLNFCLEDLQKIEKTQYAMQFIEMRKHIEKSIAWGDARIEELKKLLDGSKLYKEKLNDNKH